MPIQTEQEMDLKKRLDNIRPLPIFEILLVTIFSFFSIMLVVFPDFFDKGTTYTVFRELGGEPLWSFLFFLATLILGFGLIKHYAWVRRLGFGYAATMFMVCSLNFAQEFPNFSTATYLALFTTCLVALFTIKKED